MSTGPLRGGARFRRDALPTVAGACAGTATIACDVWSGSVSVGGGAPTANSDVPVPPAIGGKMPKSRAACRATSLRLHLPSWR